MTKETYETALRWLELGISTIPILYRSKTPALESWKEWQTVLPRKKQLEAWFKNTQYSIAVICGWQNLVIIDFDCELEFTKWWHNIEARYDDFVYSYEVKTPRGYHIYYYINEMPESLKLGKIDVKSHGTYVLAPPSVHPCGKPYLENINSKPCDIQRLSSLEEILPGYQEAALPRRAKSVPYDPYADAMRPWTPGNGASISEIKAQWSILDLLSVTYIDNRKDILRKYQMNCPLPDHQDNVASFTVFPSESWYCFGCRRGGDVIDLYAALHNISVQDAIREMGK